MVVNCFSIQRNESLWALLVIEEDPKLMLLTIYVTA
jgi:hypothetical protein